MKNLFAVFTAVVALLVLAPTKALASSQLLVLSYSSTNVGTSSYVSLGTVPYSVSKIQVCDTSGELIKVASGASGAQVDLYTVQVSGCVIVPQYIVGGTALWLKSINSSASTGYHSEAFLQ